MTLPSEVNAAEVNAVSKEAPNSKAVILLDPDAKAHRSTGTNTKARAIPPTSPGYAPSALATAHGTATSHPVLLRLP